MSAGPTHHGAKTDWLNGWIAFALTLCGRLALVREHGTPLAFQDPWKAFAVDILRPWVEGRLSLGQFFHTANDHLNTVSRSYSFALVNLTGEWNNLVEITGNAFLCAAGTMLLVATLAPLFAKWTGIALAWFAGIVMALPITWETTLMGMQIDVFAQIALTFVYLRIILNAERCDAAWWIAHAAAIVLLLTRRSCVLVFPAAASVLLWQFALLPSRRKTILVTIAAMLPLLAFYFLVTPAFEVTAGMRADSWQIALDVFLRQVAWPLPHPAWAPLLYLPGAWLVLDRLGRRTLRTGEAFLIAVGLWSVAQAAAIAYGRGAVTFGFVSRYCDFLSIGVIANAAALAVIWPTARRGWTKLPFAAVAVGWMVAAAYGLHGEARGGHAAHNLGQRPAINAANLAAVRTYFANHDASLLNSERVRETLYSYPPEMLGLLDHSRIRALLPAETGAPEAQRPPGPVEKLTAFTLRFGPATAAAFALGLTLVGARRPADAFIKASPAATSGWTSRHAFAASAAATLVIGAIFMTWPDRFVFDPTERAANVANRITAGATPLALTLENTMGRAVAATELHGASGTSSAAIRGAMLGTLLDEGTAFTGILRSNPFTLEQSHLSLLVSGFPCWPGNAIRWQVTDPSGNNEQWLPLVANPASPGVELLPWTENVAEFRGWTARLFIFDGNTDAHGWIAFSHAVMTDDPHHADRVMTRIRAERAEPTHRLLAIGFVIGVLATAATGIRARSGRAAR